LVQKKCSLVAPAPAHSAPVFSAFVDIYLAIYPTAVLFKLQLPFRKKMALCVALGIGLVSGIVAIYKTTRIPSLGSADFSYDTSDLVVWTVIEGSAIIIACSIPCLQPLLDMVVHRGPWSSRRTGGSSGGGRSGSGGGKSGSGAGGASGSKKSAPRFYEDYSQNGIELGQRKPKSKLRDDLGFTVVEGDDGGNSSQENILATVGHRANGSAGTVVVVDEEKGIEVTHSSAAAATTTTAPSPPQPQGAAAHGIMRTDVVAISYEQPRPQRQSQQQHPHPQQGALDDAW
jgi:hypothetical protein